MELLSKLYSIHSQSGNEGEMREFLIDYLYGIPNVNVEEDSAGNIYATKGVSETYPCIVSHIDQVQSKHSEDFKVIFSDDVILGFSASAMAQQGLGADDKNGIWICLKTLEYFDAVKAAFFVGEEIGCVGSCRADMTFFDDCRYVLQCDRRGGDDLIVNASFVDLCSTEFVDAINPESYGYKVTRGLMTDVMMLKERGLCVSCVNISCGYYNPHTDEEITLISELNNCLEFVWYIVENCTDTYYHEYECDDSFCDYGESKAFCGQYSAFDDEYENMTEEEHYYYEKDVCEDFAYEWLSKDPDAKFNEFWNVFQDNFFYIDNVDARQIFEAERKYFLSTENAVV